MPVHTFPTVIQIIRDELQDLAELRKMSPQKQKLFSVDLALIGLSVRWVKLVNAIGSPRGLRRHDAPTSTNLANLGAKPYMGYLVEVVALQHPLKGFSTLLQRLRQKISFFEDIVHLYEPASDQSFFVNVPLFVRRMAVDQCLLEGVPPCKTDDRHDLQTSFILLGLDGHPTLRSCPPDDVLAVLRDLNINLTTQPHLSSITLPILTPQTAIPLAAFLLEYPVAYVPVSSNQTSFLCRVPLDVYECVLTSHPQGDANDIHGIIPVRHTVLKFSCPSGLAKEHTKRLAPPKIRAELKARFEARSQRMATGVIFGIQQTSETRDRVAL